jgi:hypothetical protein
METKSSSETSVDSLLTAEDKALRFLSFIADLSELLAVILDSV